MKKQYDRFSSLMLAFVLAVGVAVVWSIIMTISIGPLWAKYLSNRDDEVLFVLRDGTPVIYSSMPGDQSCRMLDGRLVSNFKQSDDTWGGVWLAGPEWKNSHYPSIPWSERIIMAMDDIIPPGGNKPAEICYFIQNGRSDGRAYFVFYDRQSWMCTGYLGRNGFSRTLPDDNDQFHVDSRWLKIVGRFGVLDYTSHYISPRRAYITINILTDEGIYEIDYCRHAVKLLVADDTLCSVSSIKATPKSLNLPADAPPPPPVPQRLIARTPDRVMIYDESGKPLRSYLLPEEIRDKDFRWFDLDDGKIMITVAVGGPDFLLFRLPYDTGDVAIYWLDENGQIVEHREVALQSAKNASAGLWSIIVLPSPAMQLVNTIRRGHQIYYEKASVSLHKKLADQGAWLVIITIVSVAFAGLCYRRQRAYGMPWTWMWVVFVLVLGVPGWLGYLAHRRWPIRLPCPNCDGPSPRDRPTCINCGQDFPAPAPTGSEVFA